MDLKTTRYEITDRIGVITLARPKRRNAWTGRMHTEYRWRPSQADQDPGVRVIVVTGDPEVKPFAPAPIWAPWRAMPKRAAMIRASPRTSPGRAMAWTRGSTPVSPIISA